MKFIELLVKRRSIRKFSSQQIEREKIELLQKALLLSPTGKNKREWEFIQIENKETLKQLSGFKEHGSELIEKASLAFVIIADTAISDVWIEDCSIASIILQLAAEEMGLGSCWVQCRLRKQADGTESETYIKNILDIPSHFSVLNIIAIGHKLEDKKPIDIESLPTNKIHLERF